MMWRAVRQALVLVCGMGVFLNATVQASSASESMPTERLILRLHADATLQPAAQTATSEIDARLRAVLADMRIDGVTFERTIGGDILIARLAPGTSPKQARVISELLSSHPDIRYAEPDGRVRPVFVPADPLRTDQWFHYDTYGIRAYDAWNVERGSAGVVMALLDTGILTHEDLDVGRILPGYDFVSSTTYSNDGDELDADPTDPGDAVVADECGPGAPAEDSSWHGLHLAGIMIAETDNNIGVAGLNHASRLLPVRVLGKCGGSYSDIIAGILWAAGLPGSGAATVNPTPARVINLSFAAEQTCTAGIQDAIDRAVAAGVVVVAAAGNGYGLNVSGVLPAGCDNVIAVAATTRGGDIAGYSNVGGRVLLSAPGGDDIVLADGILSLHNAGPAAPGADDYAYFAGTSVAAAQVTAGISLLFSAKPGLTLSKVRTILRQTAQAFPAGGCPAANCGAGILDLNAAVRVAQSSTTDSSSAKSSGGGGGGGGGCALRADATDRSGSRDLAWLLILLGLVALRRAVHASRV